MDSNQPKPSIAEPQISAPPPVKELPAFPEKRLPAPEKTSWGALIGIIIILILLVVGALYFWGAKLEQVDSAGTLPGAESAR